MISAFFPSLLFWGLTLIAIVIQEVHLDIALSGWTELNDTVKMLLLVAFFAWVTFWTFLTLIFRVALVRLFEGYYPKANFFRLFEWFFKWRQRHWQERWDKLKDMDNELLRQKQTLFTEKKEYERLHSLGNGIKKPDEALPDINNELSNFINRTKLDLNELETGSSSIIKLKQIGHDIREWQVRLQSYLMKDVSYWRKIQMELNDIIKLLEKIIEQQLDEIERKRIEISHDLFLYYPPSREDIMPTRLGNVLKSAEMYSLKRYYLDAVVIWPRLQPYIPKEYTDQLEDAKTPLDLMVTISAFILFFGLLISADMIVTSSLQPILRVLLFVIMLSIVLILAWVAYQNAIQSALAYGEKIKTAFDLYRWKVLEGFHLQLPKDLIEERNMWRDVCEFIHRGYAPDPQYYRYIQPESKKESMSE